MKRIGYIYKTTNLINGKIYIGKHEREELDKKYYGSGRVLRLAIKKYGKENFKVEIIDWVYTEEELNEKEIRFILAYNSNNPKIGYNRTRGGDGFTGKHTNKTKKKISNKEKGKSHSEEWCKNISLGLTGRVVSVPKSKKTRLLLSIKNKGQNRSQEARNNISKGKKGKKQTDEAIRINSKCHKGAPTWNKGLKKGYTESDRIKNLEIIKMYWKNKKLNNIKKVSGL